MARRARRRSVRGSFSKSLEVASNDPPSILVSATIVYLPNVVDLMARHRRCDLRVSLVSLRDTLWDYRVELDGLVNVLEMASFMHLSEGS